MLLWARACSEKLEWWECLRLDISGGRLHGLVGSEAM